MSGTVLTALQPSPQGKSHHHQEDTLISVCREENPALQRLDDLRKAPKRVGIPHVSPATPISAVLIFYDEAEIYKVKQLFT